MCCQIGETHIIFSFFYISQKNSAKAKETSGGWLKVFSETPQNASMLLHFATALHKKKNMFSMEPKYAFILLFKSNSISSHK